MSYNNSTGITLNHTFLLRVDQQKVCLTIICFTASGLSDKSFHSLIIFCCSSKLLRIVTFVGAIYCTTIKHRPNYCLGGGSIGTKVVFKIAINGKNWVGIGQTETHFQVLGYRSNFYLY